MAQYTYLGNVSYQIRLIENGITPSLDIAYLKDFILIENIPGIFVDPNDNYSYCTDDLVRVKNSNDEITSFKIDIFGNLTLIERNGTIHSVNIISGSQTIDNIDQKIAALLSNKVDVSTLGVSVATLNPLTGKVTATQLPDTIITTSNTTNISLSGQGNVASPLQAYFIGTLQQSQINGLITTLNNLLPKNVPIINNSIYGLVTYDSNGLVLSGRPLVYSDLPAIDISNITNLQATLNSKVNKAGSITAGKYSSVNVNSDGIVTSGDNTSVLLIGGGQMQGFLTLYQSPTSPLHAATKQYVDTIAEGLSPKEIVVAATIANITLSGLQTIDSVVLQLGDRVLVKDQTTASGNGIYIVSTSTWARATDAITIGSYYVVGGSENVNGGTGWVVTQITPNIVFTQFSGNSNLIAGIGLYRNGNVINLRNSTSTEIGGVIINGNGLSINNGLVSVINYNNIEFTSNKNIENGYLGILGTGKVNSSFIPISAETNNILINNNDGLFVPINLTIFNATYINKILTLTYVNERSVSSSTTFDLSTKNTCLLQSSVINWDIDINLEVFGTSFNTITRINFTSLSSKLSSNKSINLQLFTSSTTPTTLPIYIDDFIVSNSNIFYIGVSTGELNGNIFNIKIYNDNGIFKFFIKLN